jgi:PAS domain S-box-containing protein
VRVNRTLLSWTGHEAAALVGRRFQDLLTTGGRIYWETHYAPLLRMQGEVREIALELVRADGTALPVLVGSSLGRGPDGQPLLVRTTVFDARQRREYERELLRARERAEAADRAKAEFISTVSHEIRTPLSAIMAVAHLLESTGVTAAQEKFLRILRSSSSNLLELINDILDFSRIEAGRLQLDERPFELRAHLAELTAAQRVGAERKGLRLEVEVDPRCPEHLVGDKVKLGQILTNLIGNAVKFTEEGTVRLTAALRALEGEDATISFSVADTGIGISADRLPHVFDAFTQASPEVTSRYGGTGLGLAITKRLVELHGGDLRAKSEPGRGSTFSFEVQLRRAEPAAVAAPRPDAAEERPLAGLVALVADDNEVNIAVLEGLLTGWGAAVEAVSDGEGAIERIQQRRYDIVLMDLRMPKVDGSSATRRIRSLPAGERLPILAVSASMRMGESADLAEAGFDDFVGKPINPDLLLSKILRWTGPEGRGDEAEGAKPGAR